MKQNSPAAQLYVDLSALAALAATIMAHLTLGEDRGDWLAFGLLALCGAVAHLFPIRAASNNLTYRLTNTFVLAGAILLSPLQAAMLPGLAYAPDLWVRRRMPGIWAIWLFNTAQTALSALVVASWVRWTGITQVDTAGDLAALMAAVALFTVVQAALVGVIISLNSGRPITKTGTFAPAALLGDGVIGAIGILVGGLWLAKPVLLLAIPPFLFAVHRLTRTAHLAQLAETDPKTGLHNSRHFERALEEELAHSRRVNRPLALLFADLDHFKQVNDRHGHDAGDLVLRDFAGLLRGLVRKGDLVARFGGEEFVALLPGTDAHEALYLAERLRAAVEQHRFALADGAELRCTVSVGVGVHPVDGADASSLLRVADTAMYRAKQTRNAVARAEQAPAPASPLPAVPVSRLPAAPPAPQPRQDAGPSRHQSRLAGIVLLGTIAGAVTVSVWSLLAIAQTGSWSMVLPFFGLAVAAELLRVRIYEAKGQALSFSLGVAVSMASVGAATMAAPLIALVGALVHVATTGVRRPDKLLFNLANSALSAGVAGWTYGLLWPGQPGFTTLHLAAALGAMLAFSAVNVGVVSLMISLQAGRPFLAVLREAGWFVPTNILLGLTGTFLGGAYQELGLLGTAMFAVPVLLMRFTLAFYAQRSQETIRTLEGQAEKLERQREVLQEQAERLEHQAWHDSLTNLPNRLLLLERLGSILAAGRREPPAALLVLDLDRFKEINDAFGHHHGDLLLQEMSRRLKSALRASDTVARLGGDEFAVLLPSTGPEEAGHIAHKLLRTLGEPFVVEGCSLDVGASIGIAIGPTHGSDAATLLRHADVAMYVAKQGRSGYAVYSQEQDQFSADRLALIGELREAIEQEGLTLHYQPKVCVQTGHITSVEALLRWPHPQRGFVPPDQIIALAEHTGLIRPLTRWVLDTALRQCRAWMDDGREVPVAVNVSMHDLQDRGFPELVAKQLASRDVPARCLRLEITEGAMMADPARALEVLARLRALEVGISVDDFGTGYSSLAYLKRLPVDELKIDRSFVQHMATNGSDLAIVQATIAMAHSLALTVVAEGVEDRFSSELLARLGCDAAQGYYLSRPLPAADLTRLLEESRWGLRTVEVAA